MHPIHWHATGVTMSIHDRKLRGTRRLIAGITLAFAVSFSAAAMVAFLPETPKQTQATRTGTDYGGPAMSEYMQLHQARHTAVPSYMPIDIAAKAQ